MDVDSNGLLWLATSDNSSDGTMTSFDGSNWSIFDPNIWGDEMLEFDLLPNGDF